MSDPCLSCRAPLAADQRYCLECGARGREPRVDWRALLLPGDRGASATRPRPAATARVPTPRVIAALLLTVMGSGVLLGGVLGPQAPDGVAASLPDGTTIALAAPAPTATPAPAPSPVATAEAWQTPAPADDGASPPKTEPARAQPAPAPTPRPTPTATPTPAPAEKPAPAVPDIGHVFVVSLGPNTFEALFGARAGSRFLATDLAAKGTLLSRFAAVGTGELANQVALISGQRPNPQTEVNCPTHALVMPGTVGEDGLAVGEGCVFPSQVFTLPDQLVAAGSAWRAYIEGQDLPAAAGQPPATCRRPAVGQPDPWQYPRPDDPYVPWRNPFIYFETITESPTCTADDVGLAPLADDLEAPADEAPAFSWVAPSPCHDGREAPCAPGAPAGPAVADAWLAEWMPRILASPAYAEDGLVAIVPDASGTEDPRTGALLLSPRLREGRTVRTPYDQLSLLKSLGELLGLRPLGAAQDDAVRSFGRDVYGVTRTSR